MYKTARHTQKQHWVILVAKLKPLKFIPLNFLKIAMGGSRSGKALPVVMAMFLLFSMQLSYAKPVTLNLKSADISALISTVAELTGKNFVVDPRVKGKITVVSAHPMEKGEIYEVFLSILEVHGFAAVPSGDVIKIVPDVKAKQGGIPTLNRGGKVGADEMVTRVIQVDNIQAAQLVPILRPLIPQQGHLAAYPTTNVLIISDRASNVDRITKIINRIDQVSDSEIDVVRLEHSSAAEMVRIINGLQQTGAKQAPTSSQVQLAADERTNSILLSGERAARLRIKAIIGHLDTPLSSGGNTKVVYLRYSKAADLVKVLTGVSESIEKDGKKGKAKTAPSSPVNIQADEASNALVITAPPDVFRSLQSVINQLDVRRAQVLVEAVIAEVNMDTLRQLGVEWVVGPGDKATKGDNTSSTPLGIINFGGLASAAALAAGANAGVVPEFPGGALLGGGQFNKDKEVNFAALIRALANDATTNILSTPSLMTLDNQEAEILVGQEVPFVTGEYSSTGGGSTPTNPFRTIERQDVGVILRVTPQINEGNAIKLELEQEVSSVAATATNASDLTTQKRKIKTTVMVEDGNTVVLGGLMEERLRQSNQKVPLLGDIPLLGRLFRSDNTSKTKLNLMVFIRPVIVRDAATETKLTSGKYNFIRAEQLKIREDGVAFLPDESSPLLPENIDLPLPFDIGSGAKSGGSKANKGSDNSSDEY